MQSLISVQDIQNKSLDSYKDRAIALGLDTLDLEVNGLHRLIIKNWNTHFSNYNLYLDSIIFINALEDKLIIDLPNPTIYINNINFKFINELDKSFNFYFNIDLRENQYLDYYSYFSMFDILESNISKLNNLYVPIIKYTFLKLALESGVNVDNTKSLLLYINDIELFFKSDYKYLYDSIILYVDGTVEIMKEKDLFDLFIEYCKKNNINFYVYESLS